MARYLSCRFSLQHHWGFSQPSLVPPCLGLLQARSQQGGTCPSLPLRCWDESPAPQFRPGLQERLEGLQRRGGLCARRGGTVELCRMDSSWCLDNPFETLPAHSAHTISSDLMQH